VAGPAQYRGFALSPDGSRLVVARIGDSGEANLWLRELTGGRETQLTFDGAAFAPQWSPDGARLAFSGYAHRPPPNLFVTDLSLPGAPVHAGQVQSPEFASSWSGDGGTILTVRTQDATNGHDLWIRRHPGGAAERLAVNTPAHEFLGELSPDGQWLAFVTDQAGRDEVWVARMPDGSERQRLSAGGATMPQWRGDGRELFFVSDDRRLMAATFNERIRRWDNPQSLLAVPGLIDVDREVWPTVNAYLAAPDGKRFLVAERAADPTAPPISILVNWPTLFAR
jgi:Tol biopolymer transport system component